MRPIHALDRGLHVLLRLSALGAASLHELHEDTRVPKASLLRILLTLTQRGMVWRRIADGRYQASHRFARRMRYPGRTERLVEAASPILDALCARLGWPSDLAVARGDCIEICETNRPHAPIHLNRDLVGLRVPMLVTAHGRAYLAACSEEKRETLLAWLRKSRRHGNELARNRAWVERVMQETRAQGYGTRDPAFPRYRGDRYDGLQAIAVPVFSRASVVATINMVWVERLGTPREMAARHLADLKEAAQRIGQALER